MKYTAIVQMISTEYTLHGDSLPCEDLSTRIWYCLNPDVIAYSTIVESVEVKATTVKALDQEIYKVITRMENDIAQMSKEYRTYATGYTRTK